MFKPLYIFVPLCSLVAFALGCGSSERPLSIRMYNPKTFQELTCAARDQTQRSDASLLAGAVENCAKTLEAQGFVRQN